MLQKNQSIYAEKTDTFGLDAMLQKNHVEAKTESGLVIIQEKPQIDIYFPLLNHGIVPCGGHVLIQGKTIPTMTKSGLALPDEFRQLESYDIQIGKIVAMGPLAYKNKDTLVEWKEGKWAEIGDFVHIPRTGAKMSKVIDGERYWFALINDIEVIAKVTSLDEFTQFSY